MAWGKALSDEGQRGDRIRRARWLVSDSNDRRPPIISTQDEMGKVTIAGKLSIDLPIITAHSIFKQAQIPWPKGKR